MACPARSTRRSCLPPVAASAARRTCCRTCPATTTAYYPFAYVTRGPLNQPWRMLPDRRQLLLLHDAPAAEPAPPPRRQQRQEPCVGEQQGRVGSVRGDAGTLAKKSGNIFRVGIFLDFAWLTTRTMHPHGAYVREPDEIELTAVGVELNGSRCRAFAARRRLRSNRSRALSWTRVGRKGCARRYTNARPRPWAVSRPSRSATSSTCRTRPSP